MKVAYSSVYNHPLPENHRFPMVKYDLLPTQLRYEGVLSDAHFIEPQPVAESDILLVHTPSYWSQLKDLKLTPREQRKTGFPHTAALIHRERVIMQGTVDAAIHALTGGVGLNIAGGTHHAFTNHGEGFCLLNDIAIASRVLQERHGVKQVLVIDLDVHQGNGTAEVFQNDNSVFTLSMHGAQNYPLHKERSDLDLPMPDGCDDEQYLKVLNHHLPRVLDNVSPDFVFFQSGVDVLEGDKLGRMKLSIQGCKDRDEFVLSSCFRRNIPVCLSMGGGYSEQLAQIINAHANTFRLAHKYWG